MLVFTYFSCAQIQFVLLAAIVAVSQALVLPNGQVITSGGVVAPVGVGIGHYGVGVAKVAAPVIAKTITDDYDPNPQYSYSYDINVSRYWPHAQASTAG